MFRGQIRNWLLPNKLNKESGTLWRLVWSRMHSKRDFVGLLIIMLSESQWRLLESLVIRFLPPQKHCHWNPLRWPSLGRSGFHPDKSNKVPLCLLSSISSRTRQDKGIDFFVRRNWRKDYRYLLRECPSTLLLSQEGTARQLPLSHKSFPTNQLQLAAQNPALCRRDM